VDEECLFITGRDDKTGCYEYNLSEYDTQHISLPILIHSTEEQSMSDSMPARSVWGLAS
jgi:hypothetical protein